MVDSVPRIPTGEEPEFAADELLYIRVRPLDPNDEDLDEVTIADIPSLPFSVNRGALSNPEDVIRGHPGWGIISFPVGAIPPQLVDPNGVIYEFRKVPKVEHGNIAHVDITVFKSGEEVTNKKIGETVKSLFRESVRKRARFVRKPSRLPFPPH